MGHQFFSGTCIDGASILCPNGATNTTPFTCINDCGDNSNKIIDSGNTSKFACQLKPVY